MKCKQCGGDFFEGDCAVVHEGFVYHEFCLANNRRAQRAIDVKSKFPFLTDELARYLDDDIRADPKSKIFVVIKTEDCEYDMHSFVNEDGMKEYLIRTEHNGEGWEVEAVFIDGVRYFPAYETTVTLHKES